MTALHANQRELLDEAVYYVPRNSFKAANDRVPVHAFEAERIEANVLGGPSKVIVMDLSEAMGLPFPATLPNVLARYIRLTRGQVVDLELNATAAIHYVISGSGYSQCGEDRLEWSAGDLFVLPGSEATTHHAASDNALLYTATDEPLLNYAGLAPAKGAHRRKPALFPVAEIDRHLATAYAREQDKDDAGKAVIFATRQMGEMYTTSAFLTVNINTLPAGEAQRAHRHNAAALTLCVQGEGVHSLVGGERAAWQPSGVLVTPPGVLHSHHNHGSSTMRSIVVQDSGLYYHGRISGFSFDV